MLNRDLYQSVSDLISRHEAVERSLADFLRTLRQALTPHFGERAIATTDFLRVLEAGFVSPAPLPQPSWRQEDLRIDYSAPADADAVDAILKSQVLDLEDADASGALADELRFFGRSVDRASNVERATGDYYYNWDPHTYVECGVAGAFGGWGPGDNTERELVPGLVGVMTEVGVQSVPAADIDRPISELDYLTWQQVVDFLQCGQSYE